MKPLYKIKIAIVDNDKIFAGQLSEKLFKLGIAKINIFSTNDFFTDEFRTQHDKFNIIAIDYLSLRAFFKDLKNFPSAINNFSHKNIFILYPNDISEADIERIPKPDNTMHIIKDENMTEILLSQINYFHSAKVVNIRKSTFKLSLAILFISVVILITAIIFSFF